MDRVISTTRCKLVSFREEHADKTVLVLLSNFDFYCLVFKSQKWTLSLQQDANVGLSEEKQTDSAVLVWPNLEIWIT